MPTSKKPSKGFAEALGELAAGEFRKQSRTKRPDLFEDADPIILAARRTPAGFADFASGGTWVKARHLAVLDEHLRAVERGDIKRLAIEMPPRHGKSEFASRYFPPHFLGRNPNKRVILTSYEAQFAASWGRKARDLLERFGPEVFGIRVSQASHAADNWLIADHSGGMVTSGVGGPITGKGADLFIIDDPVKNAQDANSPTVRDATWDWYTSTAYTRLEPGGAIIVIQTRWHHDDLTGRILRYSDEPWVELKLPALALEGDPLGRQLGEALWPQRYNAEALAKIRDTLGGYWFGALYQQNPSEGEGALFKREHFRYFDHDATTDHYRLYGPGGLQVTVPVSSCWRLQTVDLAVSQKETADYFVIQTWAVTPTSDLLLLDVFRERVEGPKQPGLLAQYYHAYRPSFIGIEKQGYQLRLLQDALALGLPARELKADTDKVSRATTIATRYENGKVYHKAQSPWLANYEGELLRFPAGEHDDMVDAAAYAALAVASARPPRVRQL